MRGHIEKGESVRLEQQANEITKGLCAMPGMSTKDSQLCHTMDFGASVLHYAFLTWKRKRGGLRGRTNHRSLPQVPRP